MKYLNLLRNVQNWPAFLSLKFGLTNATQFIFTLKPTPIQVSMPRAMKVLFKEIFMIEIYQPSLDMIQNDKPVVVDVGGNMGYFGLYTFLRKPLATVYSFEPVPTNFKFLTAHQKAHPQFNWIAYNQAMADREGTMDFYYNDHDSPEGIDTAASLFSSENIDSVTSDHHKITVETQTLAGWIDKQKIETIDLLKLDCEGAEYSIIYTLPESYFSRIKLIAADVHPMKAANENIDALAQFLSGKGYKIKTDNQEMLYATR